MGMKKLLLVLVLAAFSANAGVARHVIWPVAKYPVIALKDIGKVIKTVLW